MKINWWQQIGCPYRWKVRTKDCEADRRTAEKLGEIPRLWSREMRLLCREFVAGVKHNFRTGRIW